MMMNEQKELQNNQFSAVLLSVFSVLCFGMALQILVDQTPRTVADGQVAGAVTSAMEQSEIVIQAEDFNPGVGVGFWDNTPGNSGNVEKPGDVDVTNLADAIVVENFTYGEWLSYSLTPLAGGEYQAIVRVMAGSGGKLALEVDGQTQAIVSLPDTHAAVEVRFGTVNLIAGKQQQLRLINEGGVLAIDNIVLRR